MPDADYSKREIDVHFNNLIEHMTSFEAETGASLMRIERQTTATNGRVNKLENWKNFIAGGLAVLTFLVTALIGLLAILAQTGKL